MNPKRIEKLIKLSLKPAITLLILSSVSLVGAQTFTNLHSFTIANGAYPNAMILSGNTLFGTTSQGGSLGYGTVFAVNTDGTGFTNLHSFTALPPPSFATNSDGANPYGGLILSGNTLYGTASGGGIFGGGTVFAVNTNGTGFTNLYNFTTTDPNTFDNIDGASPEGTLILSGNILYGTAYRGGSSSKGTVFAINTDGTGFMNLHSFHSISVSDGVNPQAGLILSGNTLYGTTSAGGTLGGGTVFAININGGGFTNLYNFTDENDGASPKDTLILFGNTLYGTAEQRGSLFAINTDGTGFTILHTFTNGSDGGNPFASFVLSGNTLYATASQGGSLGYGTVFAINTDGTGFTNLYSFTEARYPNYTNSDGANPQAGLILSGNTLYGTTHDGGSSGYGTVFRLLISSIIPPTLTLQFSAGCPQLNLAGTLSNNYVVQYSTNLANPNWINLFSVTNLSASPYSFLDSSGVGQPTRYYRAVMQ
jgi:uncharacterized repeat protein (TIGR03803 family)